MVDDALPGIALRRVPQARAAGRDARVGRGAGHLGHHQAGTAHGARAQVHQMVVAGQAVDAAVLRHRRDDHAVLQRHAAYRVRGEHRRRRRHMRRQLHADGLGEPALEAFEPGLVAQAQVLVADALAAREHRVHELLGRQLIGITFADVLEPFHRVPGGVLQPQHVHPAQRLVALQHLRNALGGVAQLLELPRQLDRVLDRQLGARADGEVRGVHRIAHQHHMGAAVEKRPLFAGDALEVQPGRAAQVARVGHQLVALQICRQTAFRRRRWIRPCRPCPAHAPSIRARASRRCRWWCCRRTCRCAPGTSRARSSRRRR